MKNVPKHLAIIMDGNGRWAQSKNLPRSMGHKEGSENIKRIALAANKLGIKYLTLFAFSSENWKRPEEEIKYLFKLPQIFFDLYLKDLLKNNIRVTYIGILEQFPDNVQTVINNACEKTKHNTGLTLCIAINYGSQQEIVLASKKYAQQCLEANTLIDLTTENFHNYLFHSDYPMVDLLIRTSGEQRISNFLLWQISYAELIFVEEHWPDFTQESLENCIHIFNKRDRRFGGLNNEN